jgi:hypothetical protein
VQRTVGLFVCIALLVALPQGPWRHVHTHGHDGHHARGRLHAHHVDRPVGLAWRTHGPDEDARSLTDAIATAGPHFVRAVAVLTTGVELPQPPLPHCVPTTPGPNGHDPPPRARPKSRAPPVPPPSSLA